MAQTFVINLDRDAARMDAMTKMLAQFDADFERMPALTPQSISAEMHARFKKNTVLSGGEIGCFASHLTILEQLQALSDDWYLILEDDIALTVSPEVLRSGLKGVEADLVKLEYPPKSGSLLVAETPSGKIVRPWKIPTSTAAMFVRPQAASKILEAARDLDLPYDWFLRDLSGSHLDVLTILPPPVKHLGVESSIDPAGTRAQKPPQRTGFAGRPGPGARLRGWLRRDGLISTLSVLRAHWRYKLRKDLRMTPDAFVVRARNLA